MLPINLAAERFPAWLGAAAAGAAVAMAGRKLSAGDLVLTCAQPIARGAYAIATRKLTASFLGSVWRLRKLFGSAADQVHGKGTSSIL